MRFTVKNLTETAELAQTILKNYLPASGKGATVICLRGNLGAGKTTFTQSLARALGVKETVISPTFVIEKKYPLKNHSRFKTLIHLDCYRLNSSAELLQLDWTEITADSRHLIVIEWPERVADILPANWLTLSFTVLGENSRQVEVRDYAQ